jgi:hypothetical protein
MDENNSGVLPSYGLVLCFDTVYYVQPVEF